MPHRPLSCQGGRAGRLLFDGFLPAIFHEPVLLQKALGEPRELLRMIEGVLKIEPDGEAICVRTAVAYLSQEQSVTPFHLHGAAEWHAPIDHKANAAAGTIRDSTQKLGVAFAQYSDMHWLIGFQPWLGTRIHAASLIVRTCGMQ